MLYCKTDKSRAKDYIMILPDDIFEGISFKVIMMVFIILIEISIVKWLYPELLIQDVILVLIFLAVAFYLVVTFMWKMMKRKQGVSSSDDKTN